MPGLSQALTILFRYEGHHENYITLLYASGRRFALAFVCTTCDSRKSLPLSPRRSSTEPGPDWKSLGEADFVNVNTDPDTWTWKDGEVHCTGKPVGVTRRRSRSRISSWSPTWRHLQVRRKLGDLRVGQRRSAQGP